MPQVPLSKIRAKLYGRINIHDKRYYFDCARYNVGTPENHYIPSLSGLELCIGIHRGTGIRGVYAIMYRKDMWKENDVWRWWKDNKNRCTWFK